MVFVKRRIALFLAMLMLFSTIPIEALAAVGGANMSPATTSSTTGKAPAGTPFRAGPQGLIMGLVSLDNAFYYGENDSSLGTWMAKYASHYYVSPTTHNPDYVIGIAANADGKFAATKTYTGIPVKPYDSVGPITTLIGNSLKDFLRGNENNPGNAATKLKEILTVAGFEVEQQWGPYVQLKSNAKIAEWLNTEIKSTNPQLWEEYRTQMSSNVYHPVTIAFEAVKTINVPGKGNCLVSLTDVARHLGGTRTSDPQASKWLSRFYGYSGADPEVGGGFSDALSLPTQFKEHPNNTRHTEMNNSMYKSGVYTVPATRAELRLDYNLYGSGNASWATFGQWYFLKRLEQNFTATETGTKGATAYQVIQSEDQGIVGCGMFIIGDMQPVPGSSTGGDVQPPGPPTGTYTWHIDAQDIPENSISGHQEDGLAEVEVGGLANGQPALISKNLEIDDFNFTQDNVKLWMNYMFTSQTPGDYTNYTTNISGYGNVGGSVIGNAAATPVQLELSITSLGTARINNVDVNKFSTNLTELFSSADTTGVSKATALPRTAANVILSKPLTVKQWHTMISQSYRDNYGTNGVCDIDGSNAKVSFDIPLIEILGDQMTSEGLHAIAYSTKITCILNTGTDGVKRIPLTNSEVHFAMYEGEPKKTYKFLQQIKSPNAQVKQGGLDELEEFEAMSGTPTTEDLFITQGGNSFVVNMQFRYCVDDYSRTYTVRTKKDTPNYMWYQVGYKGGPIDTDPKGPDPTEGEIWDGSWELENNYPSTNSPKGQTDGNKGYKENKAKIEEEAKDLYNEVAQKLADDLDHLLTHIDSNYYDYNDGTQKLGVLDSKDKRYPLGDSAPSEINELHDYYYMTLSECNNVTSGVEGSEGQPHKITVAYSTESNDDRVKDANKQWNQVANYLSFGTSGLQKKIQAKRGYNTLWSRKITLAEANGTYCDLDSAAKGKVILEIKFYKHVKGTADKYSKSTGWTEKADLDYPSVNYITKYGSGCKGSCDASTCGGHDKDPAHVNQTSAACTANSNCKEVPDDPPSTGTHTDHSDCSVTHITTEHCMHYVESGGSPVNYHTSLGDTEHYQQRFGYTFKVSYTGTYLNSRAFIGKEIEMDGWHIGKYLNYEDTITQTFQNVKYFDIVDCNVWALHSGVQEGLSPLLAKTQQNALGEDLVAMYCKSAGYTLYNVNQIDPESGGSDFYNGSTKNKDDTAFKDIGWRYVPKSVTEAGTLGTDGRLSNTFNIGATEDEMLHRPTLVAGQTVNNLPWSFYPVAESTEDNIIFEYDPMKQGGRSQHSIAGFIRQALATTFYASADVTTAYKNFIQVESDFLTLYEKDGAGEHQLTLVGLQYDTSKLPGVNIKPTKKEPNLVSQSILMDVPFTSNLDKYPIYKTKYAIEDGVKGKTARHKNELPYYYPYAGSKNNPYGIEYVKGGMHTREFQVGRKLPKDDSITSGGLAKNTRPQPVKLSGTSVNRLGNSPCPPAANFLPKLNNYAKNANLYTTEATTVATRHARHGVVPLELNNLYKSWTKSALIDPAKSDIKEVRWYAPGATGEEPDTVKNTNAIVLPADNQYVTTWYRTNIDSTLKNPDLGIATIGYKGDTYTSSSSHGRVGHQATQFDINKTFVTGGVDGRKFTDNGSKLNGIAYKTEKDLGAKTHYPIVDPAGQDFGDTVGSQSDYYPSLSDINVSRSLINNTYATGVGTAIFKKIIDQRDLIVENSKKIQAISLYDGKANTSEAVKAFAFSRLHDPSGGTTVPTDTKIEDVESIPIDLILSDAYTTNVDSTGNLVGTPLTGSSANKDFALNAPYLCPNVEIPAEQRTGYQRTTNDVVIYDPAIAIDAAIVPPSKYLPDGTNQNAENGVNPRDQREDVNVYSSDSKESIWSSVNEKELEEGTPIVKWEPKDTSDVATKYYSFTDDYIVGGGDTDPIAIVSGDSYTIQMSGQYTLTKKASEKKTIGGTFNFEKGDTIKWVNDAIYVERNNYKTIADADWDVALESINTYYAGLRGNSKYDTITFISTGDNDEELLLDGIQVNVNDYDPANYDDDAEVNVTMDEPDTTKPEGEIDDTVEGTNDNTYYPLILDAVKEAQAKNNAAGYSSAILVDNSSLSVYCSPINVKAGDTIMVSVPINTDDDAIFKVDAQATSGNFEDYTDHTTHAETITSANEITTYYYKPTVDSTFTGFTLSVLDQRTDSNPKFHTYNFYKFKGKMIAALDSLLFTNTVNPTSFSGGTYEYDIRHTSENMFNSYAGNFSTIAAAVAGTLSVGALNIALDLDTPIFRIKDSSLIDPHIVWNSCWKYYVLGWVTKDGKNVISSPYSDYLNHDYNELWWPDKHGLVKISDLKNHGCIVKHLNKLYVTLDYDGNNNIISSINRKVERFDTFTLADDTLNLPFLTIKGGGVEYPLTVDKANARGNYEAALYEFYFRLTSDERPLYDVAYSKLPEYRWPKEATSDEDKTHRDYDWTKVEKTFYRIGDLGSKLLANNANEYYISVDDEFTLYWDNFGSIAQSSHHNISNVTNTLGIGWDVKHSDPETVYNHGDPAESNAIYSYMTSGTTAAGTKSPYHETYTQYFGSNNGTDCTKWIYQKAVVFNFDVYVFREEGDTYDYTNPSVGPYNITGTPDTNPKYGMANSPVFVPAGTRIFLGQNVTGDWNADCADITDDNAGHFVDFADPLITRNPEYPYTYRFWCALSAEETNSATVDCQVWSINSMRNKDNSTSETFCTPDGSYNGNEKSSNKESITSTAIRKTDAKYNVSCPIVGRIGALTIIDTGDPRFADTFKVARGDSYLIYPLIRDPGLYTNEVNKDGSQNKIVLDPFDVRGRIAEQESLELFRSTIHPTSGDYVTSNPAHMEEEEKRAKFYGLPGIEGSTPYYVYQTGDNDYGYNTYGSQWYKDDSYHNGISNTAKNTDKNKGNTDYYIDHAAETDNPVANQLSADEAWYYNKNILPLSGYNNDHASLNLTQHKLGYELSMSLESIGNYYGSSKLSYYHDSENVGKGYVNESGDKNQLKVQIRPIYYHYDPATGDIQPVDVYARKGNDYVLINSGSDYASDYVKPIYDSYYINTIATNTGTSEIDLDQNMLRHSVTESESKITKDVLNHYGSLMTSMLTPITREANNVIGGGEVDTAYTYGNTGMMFLRERNRTFVGGATTALNRAASTYNAAPMPGLNGSTISYDEAHAEEDEEVTLSNPEDFDAPDLFEVSYEDMSALTQTLATKQQAQKWYFGMYLPSSSVFVPVGETPTWGVEGRGRTVFTAGYIISAIDVYAHGTVWTLHYTSDVSKMNLEINDKLIPWEDWNSYTDPEGEVKCRYYVPVTYYDLTQSNSTVDRDTQGSH